MSCQDRYKLQPNCKYLEKENKDLLLFLLYDKIIEANLFSLFDLVRV